MTPRELQAQTDAERYRTALRNVRTAISNFEPGLPATDLMTAIAAALEMATVEANFTDARVGALLAMNIRARAALLEACAGMTVLASALLAKGGHPAMSQFNALIVKTQQAAMELGA